MKDLPLIGSIKRLYDAVLGKVTTEPRDETLVQDFHELGAQADWEVSLVREGLGRAHQLLEIGLDQANNLIALAVNMYLTNVIRGRVWLIAISGTELKEQGIADRGKSQAQNLGVDLGPQSLISSAGMRQAKARGMKLHGAILERRVENLSLDFGRGESAQVWGTVKGHQIVGNIVPIDHGACRLRQLDIVLRPQYGRPNLILNVHKQDEFDRQLHSNELNTWPAAVCNIVVLRQQENV